MGHNMKQALTLILLMCAGLAAHAKPLPPVVVDIQPADPLVVNTDSSLTATITALSKVDSMRVYFVLPDGVKQLSGNTRWSGSLSSGEKVSLDLQVFIQAQATDDIEVVAEIGSGTAAFKIKRSFSVGQQRHKSQFQQPPGREVDRHGRKVREIKL